MRDRNIAMAPARTIAFISNKGGVGKTHLAINLAISFANNSRRVLLVDTDLGSANADLRIGVSPTTTLMDFYEGRADMSCCLTNTNYGFRLLAGRTGEFALANLGDDQIIRLLTAFDGLVRNGGYTDIFFDLGAGISSRVLDFALAADECIIVTTPTNIVHAYSALKACWTRYCSLSETEYFKRKALTEHKPAFMTNVAFEPQQGPRINFIVNQVDNLEEGKKIYLAITKIARKFFYSDNGYWKLNMRYLGGIPECHELIKNAEKQRTPAMAMNPYHPFSHAIKEVGDMLLAKQAIAPSRLKIGFGDRIRCIIENWKHA